MANPATDPPAPEKTDPAEAGTKAGSEIIRAATIGFLISTAQVRCKVSEIERRMGVLWEIAHRADVPAEALLAGGAA